MRRGWGSDVGGERMRGEPGPFSQSAAETLRLLLASAVADASPERPPGPWRPAAVLIPIVQREEGATILFTKRTAHLHHHPGQISFPGGRVESEDGSAHETALRETEEEIGLARDRIETLGSLPPYGTGTGFCITPLVGLVRPPFELRLDAFEVAEVFEVPVSFLLERERWQRHRFQHRGEDRECNAINFNGRFIWGATADILLGLRELLAAAIGRT